MGKLNINGDFPSVCLPEGATHEETHFLMDSKGPKDQNSLMSGEALLLRLRWTLAAAQLWPADAFRLLDARLKSSMFRRYFSSGLPRFLSSGDQTWQWKIPYAWRFD